jgi:hypothetical protein
MSRHEQYNLQFGKMKDDSIYEFVCYQIGNNQPYYRLAEKLRLMHKIECIALIDSIDAALNGQYYEQYFSVDRDSASDSDGIEIIPPNIIIDDIITIPMEHMKEILQEWIDFING